MLSMTLPVQRLKHKLDTHVIYFNKYRQIYITDLATHSNTQAKIYLFYQVLSLKHLQI